MSGLTKSCKFLINIYSITTTAASTANNPSDRSKIPDKTGETSATNSLIKDLFLLDCEWQGELHPFFWVTGEDAIALLKVDGLLTN